MLDNFALRAVLMKQTQEEKLNLLKEKTSELQKSRFLGHLERVGALAFAAGAIWFTSHAVKIKNDSNEKMNKWFENSLVILPAVLAGASTVRRIYKENDLENQSLIIAIDLKNTNHLAIEEPYDDKAINAALNSKALNEMRRKQYTYS